MRGRSVLRLILCVGSLAPAGCLSSRVACDCATEDFQISSGVPIAELTATGAACPTPASTYCFHSLDGGQCDLISIAFKAAGTCHIVAIAADGRQATVDETVTLVPGSSCCGNLYRAGSARIDLFPPIDAGIQSVDAAADMRTSDTADGPKGSLVLLRPDSTGWVDRTTTGPTNIQGRWYGFADGFGADGMSSSGACELAGHAAADCSQLTMPSPGSFPNLGGKMCTMGVSARVANVVGGTTPDYNAITGAGIAFSFNVADMTATTQLPYNAVADRVVGIAFDIDTVPASGLRIQFRTAEQTMSPPFWDGATHPISPVVPGHNEVRWGDVRGPFYDAVAPPFNPTTVLRLEFLVPNGVASASPFQFCVSNLSALLE